MMRPDTFTITTFWLDWLFLPLTLVMAWLTVRWAVADSRQASNLEAGSEASIPAWSFSIPLFVVAAGWMIVGLGMLIREDYWEMRVIFIVFVLWTLGCIMGAGLLLLMFLRRDSGFGTAGILNLIGLVLMSVLMAFPALIDHSSPASVIQFAQLWFLVLAICVGLLMAGIFLGFPYRFPRFPIWLGAMFFIGLGLAEITFSKAAFPWLIRIWKLHLGLEYIDAFPVSAGWQIVGLVKVLVGIGIVAMFIIVSRPSRKAP